MKTSVVFDAFNRVIPISIRNVFVVFRKKNWKRAKLSNASIVVVVDVPVEKLSFGRIIPAKHVNSSSQLTIVYSCFLFIVQRERISKKISEN